MRDLAIAAVRLIELCAIAGLISLLPGMSRLLDTILGTKTGHDS